MVEEPRKSDSTEPAQGRAGWWNWLLTMVVAATIVLSVFNPVDRLAEREYESLIERALITFALARTLNGMISAVQGTELALQPAGVGVTLTPGEVLDPVNDLVERFSWIMLGATLSLGVQQVLLEVGQWWGVKLLLVLAGLAWLAFYLKRIRGRRTAAAGTEKYLLRVLMVMLFVRFAVPLTMIANEAVYAVFLESRYMESTQVIESAGMAIEQASADTTDAGAAEEEEGFFSSVFDSTAKTLDFQQKLDYISERASKLIEHLLQLGVVFIFQTGILPIAFLWLFLRFFRKILGI